MTTARRRSALYVPAANERALAKAPRLASDVLILDLEDSAAPDEKEGARERLRGLSLAEFGQEVAVRVNGLDTPWGTEDMLAARAAAPAAILLPKVSTPDDVRAASDALEETDAPEDLALWAMMETPAAVLNAAAIAGAHPRLQALVVGPNDLLLETGVRDRRALDPWLMTCLAAARANSLSILGGVWNDIGDMEGFAADCARHRAMGFDGMTLIHPSQIEPANAAFSPDAEELSRAREIIAAFADPANAGRGVIRLDGRMIERLHLDQARRTLSLADE